MHVLVLRIHNALTIHTLKEVQKLVHRVEQVSILQQVLPVAQHVQLMLYHAVLIHLSHVKQIIFQMRVHVQHAHLIQHVPQGAQPHKQV